MKGPSLRLDPDICAYRPDIADIALAGQLFAPHYAHPLVRNCGLESTALRSQPSNAATPICHLMPGEAFAVLDITGPWAWGYRQSDHRVGYVEAIALVGASHQPVSQSE